MKAGSEHKEPQAKRKGGRPKKAAPRSVVLVVRMTPAERILIEDKAGGAGMKTGEWFRRAARSAVIKPRFTPEEMGWLRSLAGISNNLNQLAKAANRDGLLSLAGDLRTLMAAISFYLDKLKNDDR